MPADPLNPRQARVRRTLADQTGQSAAEYMGAILIVAALLAAIAVTPIGEKLTTTLQAAICRVAGQSCDEPTTADEEAEPCPTRTTSRSATISGDVTARIFGAEGETSSLVIREDNSDGSGTFTVVDAGSLGATASLTRARGGTALSAQAALGLGLKKGRSYKFSDPGEAKAFEEALRASGGYAGIARNGADISDGVADFVTPFFDPPDIANGAQDLVGIPDDDEEVLANSDSEYFDAQVYLSGKPGVEGSGSGLDGELEAALRAARGGRLYTSGERAGQIELYYALEGEASGTLASQTLGGSLSGDAEGVATLTLDTNDGLRPLELQVEASAGYEGDLQLGPSIDAADLPGLQAALDKAEIRATAGAGQKVTFRGTLDLTQQEDVNETLGRLLSPGPGQISAVADLAERLGSDGTLELQTARTVSEGTEGSASLPGGILGVEAVDETTIEEVQDMLVREPGGSFEEPACPT